MRHRLLSVIAVTVVCGTLSGTARSAERAYRPLVSLEAKQVSEEKDRVLMQPPPQAAAPSVRRQFGVEEILSPRPQTGQLRVPHGDPVPAALNHPRADEESLRAFRLLDFNRDGVITEKEGPEAYHWSLGFFEAIDLDHSGGITYSEFMAWPDSKRVAQISRQLKDDTNR